MKKTKKKYLIILLIVLLLGLAVGYAAFSDVLTITGTANAGGDFDLEFITYQIDQTASQGIDLTNSTVTRSSDKDTLTVTVKDLAYPGAGALVHTVIKNVGTIPAKVTNVTTTLPTGNAIKVNGLDAITTGHPTIAPDGTCTLDFTVVWDPNVNTLSAAEESGVTFDLIIEYGQDTTPFAGGAAHTDA